jgi:hypothetical protein
VKDDFTGDEIERLAGAPLGLLPVSAGVAVEKILLILSLATRGRSYWAVLSGR